MALAAVPASSGRLQKLEDPEVWAVYLQFGDAWGHEEHSWVSRFSAHESCQRA